MSGRILLDSNIIIYLSKGELDRNRVGMKCPPLYLQKKLDWAFHADSTISCF